MNSQKRYAVASFTLLALQSLPANATPLSPEVRLGSYSSRQVNVDETGLNITGDRGNEPSIAINPLDSNNIVIGWRRFNPPATNGPQAGFAYSNDGGNSWHTGQLPSLEGQNRTDPVLGSDALGNFYYQSMAHGSIDSSAVFKSSDGGQTWSEPVHQFIGDKNWLAVDRSSGDSQGNIYSTWRRSGSNSTFDPNYVPKFFIRSTDGGLSYQEPDIGLPALNFGFGRIAIGPEGEVYLSGVEENVQGVNSIGIFRTGHFFLKSLNAKDPAVSPTFTAQQVDMGGRVIWLYTPDGPNPLGADGDVQVAVDTSSGSMRGNIYMFAYVHPYEWKEGEDPIDVHFVRSEDGGDSWSAPVRVNDDPSAAHAFQLFPMLSVASNSRIDAVWYDSRNGSTTPPYRYSQLFYSYSWDGGQTWSENQAVTPLFNTHLPIAVVNGQERQAEKMGDYTHMVSDNHGAHVGYSATFNGEQDVYYLNVFPDCNDNAVSDVIDIDTTASKDKDHNHIPDECEVEHVAGDLDFDGDVDREDLKLLLAVRNQPAEGENVAKDLDGDGRVTLLDARKLRILCTRPRCAVE